MASVNVMSSVDVSESAATNAWPALSILPAVGAIVEANSQFHSLDVLPPGFVARTAAAHKLLVLRGFASCTAEKFLSFARVFHGGDTRLLEWATGPIMDVVVKSDAVNYLFSRERVPFHWDGFFATEPSFLVFQCVRPPEKGGATLFTDAAKLVDLAHAEQRVRWSEIRLTYSVEKKAHYGGVITLPLLQPHPTTGRTTLRYAEPVATTLNPLDVSSTELSPEELRELVLDLEARLYDRRVCYAHDWRHGDIVVADNHALLHGRTAIIGDVGRHLRRVQIL